MSSSPSINVVNATEGGLLAPPTTCHGDSNVTTASIESSLSSPSSPTRSRSNASTEQITTPDGRSDSRSRSMSPRPARIAPSTLQTPQIRSVSRPSPVVPSPSMPSSPASFSRPTSPKPVHRSSEEPTSPTREKGHHAHHHDTHGANATTAATSISRTNSGLDLTHIFERDVEFNATHHISPQEAVDVAVAPVLDEAVVALASPAMTQDIASLVNESAEEAVLAGSGWSSPVYIPSSAQAAPASSSRSPIRGSQVRSFSPDSTSEGARGASPGSSTSFSIGTPPDERSHIAPFSQHLSEALENEAKKRHPGSDAPTPTSTNTTASTLHPTKLVAPVPFSPATTASFEPGSQVSPSPSIAALTGMADDRRPLSFVSYADVINEERLAELTGAPAGGEPTESTVDLATVLDRIELAEQHH